MANLAIDTNKKSDLSIEGRASENFEPDQVLQLAADIKEVDTNNKHLKPGREKLMKN